MLIFRGVPWIHHVHSQIAKTTSCTTPRNTLQILHHHTVDGSEIPNNHLGCINLDNNGMTNYRSQLVSRISEPSTELHCITCWAFQIGPISHSVSFLQLVSRHSNADEVLRIPEVRTFSAKSFNGWTPFIWSPNSKANPSWKLKTPVSKWLITMVIVSPRLINGDDPNYLPNGMNLQVEPFDPTKLHHRRLLPPPMSEKTCCLLRCLAV